MILRQWPFLLCAVWEDSIVCRHVALKGPDILAQGNALRRISAILRALKGRHNSVGFTRRCYALTGLNFLFAQSQGVALGWYVLPRWGGDKPRYINLRTLSLDDERKLLEETLRETGGRRVEAASRLGIDPSTLWRKMKKLGI